MAKFGWELSCELIEEVLAAGLLEILLAHTGSTFETGVDEGWGTGHDLAWVHVVH